MQLKEHYLQYFGLLTPFLAPPSASFSSKHSTLATRHPLLWCGRLKSTIQSLDQRVITKGTNIATSSTMPETTAQSLQPQPALPLSKAPTQTTNSSIDSIRETSSDPISYNHSPHSSIVDDVGVPTTFSIAPTPWKLGSTVLSTQSKYHDLLLNQPSGSVEAVLASTCEVMGFHIAELWLRTGPKTHQLINTHLRPSILEDSVRKSLNDVYYGEQSSERTHRLSPSLCKRAKENSDVVWVSSDNSVGREMLRYSISNVHTAVAIPISHESSNTNMTVIFFSMRKYVSQLTLVLCLTIPTVKESNRNQPQWSSLYICHSLLELPVSIGWHWARQHTTMKNRTHHSGRISPAAKTPRKEQKSTKIPTMRA